MGDSIIALPHRSRPRLRQVLTSLRFLPFFVHRGMTDTPVSPQSHPSRLHNTFWLRHREVKVTG